MTERQDDGDVWDVGGILVLLLLLALCTAWSLGTKPGNRFMCSHDWAPTFINCAQVH